MIKTNPRDRYALNNIQAGSKKYLQDLRKYNDYYGPTQTYLRQHPEEAIDLDNKDTERSVFQDYANAPTLDTEKSAMRKLGEEAVDIISDFTSDVANSARTWTGKLVDQFIDSDMKAIYDTEQEQEDLRKIAEYKQMHLRLNDLRKSPDDPFGNRDKEISQLENKIKQYDDYFMGEGRSHTVIAQQMFDTNKMDALDKVYANLRYISKDVDKGNYFDGSVYGALDQFGVTMSNVLSQAKGVIDWTMTTGAQGLDNLFGKGDKTNGYKTGEAIKSMDINNENDRNFLYSLYKGSLLNVGDIDQSIDDNKIKAWQNYNTRRINELSADLNANIQFAKDGKLFGIDIYDPEDIPQQFKDEQQKFGQDWWEYLNPYKALIYSVPETASTVGMMLPQVKAMGINGLLGYLSKKAPVWAISGGPAKSISGRILNSKFGTSAMQAIGVGSGIYAAEQAREEETGLEAIQAMGERVSQIVQNQGGDVKKIAQAVHDAGDRMGINTDDFQLDRIIKFALAYNIKTGDPVFDNAKNIARKGINKLINSNNALAVVDYLQALPFMSYSGSVMKNWAANMFNNSPIKYTPYAYNAAQQASKPIMQAVSDATIGKVANKFIKEGAVQKGLQLKHAGEWALAKFPLVAGEAFSEGLEEINQEELQSKYQRGLYDDYNKTPNMLDIHEVFGNVGLSFEGLAAYAGIHPWDPELSTENIRKAFHIGAATSALFAGTLRAASNVISSDQVNMRNLLAQLKNDKYISNIVANYYNQIQDQKHLELFFDAFTKAGVDRSRLQKALSDLRDAVDENNTLVRKDFVDSDIQLMNAAWSIFNNDEINEGLKENGIEKYGDLHKQIVVDGAAAIVESQKNEEKIQEGDKKVRSIQEEHINLVNEMLSDDITPERLREIEQQYPEMAHIVAQLKRDYDIYKSNRQASNLGKYGAFVRKFDSVTKFATHEGVLDYIRRNGLSEDTTLHEGEEGYDPLRLEAERIFANTKERKKALQYAYEYENRSRYNDILQDEYQFFRNKYVRQYVRNQVNIESQLDQKLRDIYNNKEERRKAIDEAYKYFNNGTYNMRDYIIERLHLLHQHNRFQRLLYARQVAADKNRRNMEIRKQTGLDTYTGLEGIIKALDREIEQYKKLQSRQLGNLTWEALFRGKDFKFDDQQEYDQEFSTLMLNKAILGPQRVLAAAYLLGYANPISLSNAFFGDQEIPDSYKSIIDQYNQLVAEENAQLDPESSAQKLMNKEALRHDKKELSKKAAWDIINRRLQENLQRRKIANRLFEEEGPITPGTVERSEQQVEAAAEIQQEGQQEMPAENPSAIEPPMSEAQKRLNEKYNHEKGKQKSLRERIDEHRKRRQAAVVEDVLEEEDEETPDIDDGEENKEAESKEEPSAVSKRAAAVVESGVEPEGEEVPEIEEEEPSTIQEDLEETVAEAGEESENEDEFDPNEGESGSEDDYEFIPYESSESIEDAEQSMRDAEAAAEEFEEEAKTNADVLENGWVLIDDYSDIEYNDQGFMTYDGEILSPDQQKVVEDDILLLGLSEQIGFDQDELPDGQPVDGKDGRKTMTNDGLTDLISQTFFYQPDPKKDEGGKDQLPILTVNGEQVKLDKPLASGRELSKNLSKPGWLRNTKKYFIVTQSQQGRNVAKNKDIRDAMTVALIIEDDKNSYATFLRPLGLTESEGKDNRGPIEVDSETARRNWLLSRHVDWRSVLDTVGDNKYTYREGQITKIGSKFPLTSSQKVKLYQEAVFKIATERARQQYFANEGTYDGFEHWWTHDPIRSDYKTDDQWKEDVAARQRLRKIIMQRSRQSLAHAGKRLLSEEEVDAQIQKLRAYRNQIIDAYLTKEISNGRTVWKFPKAVKKSVTPANIVQSNGKIDSVRDKFGNPVYRTVSDPNATIEEIQAELENGNITLGYGLGMFANDKDRWAIYGINEGQATRQFVGRGLSGKIYWMVNGPAEASERIPVMLAEEKFDTQIQIVDGKPRTIWLNNPKNLVLCLKKNPKTGNFENVNTQGYQPSAAEIIFYMLINQMGIGLDAERHAEMVEFLIHSGEKTLLKNQPKSQSDPFNVLAKKQLAWHVEEEKPVLSIGLNDGTGKWTEHKFTTDELMMQTPEGEDLRRRVISAIATQMHWNTDLSHMRSSINVEGFSNSSVAQLFRWAIDNFAKDYDNIDQYLNQRVSIFGCPQLSFRIGDFFNKRGDELVSKKDVSMLAWMLKEGKLKTDTSNNIFTAPFVFANGISVEGGVVEQETSKLASKVEDDSSKQIVGLTIPKQPKKNEKKAETTTSQFDLSNPDAYNEMVSSWRSGLEDRRKREGWYVAQTEEERQAVRDSINETKAAKDNGGISDRIMIRSPKEKISAANAINEAKKVIKNFLDQYNKAYPQNAVDPAKVSINTLTEDLIKQQWALKNGYILLDLYKNGTAKIQVRRDADFGNWRNPVTGIFSKRIGGKGTFDFDKAKTWLSKTLGIDESNIVLTKAVMRSATNEDVFGLTNVVLDRIAGEVTGYMKFSDNANAGIEYHEAWHYVNLLMHDKETRERIYKSYIQTHKALNKPGVTIADVEESMADDFKLYMEGFTDKSILGNVRRLFSNILDFLILSRRKSAYRRAFNAIASGKYANVSLDRESVKEFQYKYTNGVFSVNHSIPGLSKQELDKMTNVRTYQDIFDGTNAIINRVFAVLDLNSPKKMQRIANDGFGKVLQIVDDMIEEQSDENKIGKLQDIRNNERFLRKSLIDSFMELGIIAKVKKAADVRNVERNEINEDALKKEDDPDNTWDKFVLSSQRKENASLSTKMFLRQIPMYSKHYLEDGTPQYDIERDDYGTTKMYDSDQAWRKIIDTLWACDSYSEREQDGSYSPTSIMGLVENQKNVDPFFYSLYQKLQDLDYSGEYGDIQLKSQILATVNSSKAQVQLIKIQNPIQTKSSVEEEIYIADEDYIEADDNGAIADRQRQWIIQNDSLVSVARNIPRQWSKNLASNGLLGFSGTKGVSVVDKNFAEAKQKELNAIQKIVERNKTINKKGFVPKTQEQIQKVLDTLKPQIIEFYNGLGIECDQPSLNVYIAMMSGLEGELTPQQQMDTLDKIFNTSKVGSIQYVIEGIVQNEGEQTLQHTGSKYERALDEAFSEYAADSHIGVLALAWSAVHPSSQEFSVKDANNNRLYPINLNSYISDRVRSMNNRRSGYIQKMQKSNYCKHSIIIDAAENVNPKDTKSKIKLNTFVGIRDANNAVGADYFGITAAEDYIAKMCMTENDQIIFPTMADKKTWNSLSSSNITLTHDTMLIGPLQRDIKKHILEEYQVINPYDPEKYTSKYAWQYEAMKWYRNLAEDDETRSNIQRNAAFDLGSKRAATVGFDLDVDTGYVGSRFSDNTLKRFAGYFLDELNTLIDYYNKDSIKNLVKDKNARIANYHGKVKDGRMDFSGNGGKFRYLYDIPLPGVRYNLNHTLQGLFELQKKIEAGQAIDRSKQEGDIKKYIGTTVLGENPDGFELIRQYLNDLKKQYFSKGRAKVELLNAINNKLVQQTQEELYRISRPGSPLQLAEYNKRKGAFVPKSIPEQLLDRYTKVLQEANYGGFGKTYDAEDLQAHALFSLIGSHVVNTATSIIEVEKIFSGDPAFYKKNPYVDERAKEKIVIEKTFDTGETAVEEVEVENLDDVFSDKIKRLGGLLSPGEESRLDFSEEELEFDNTLNCSKYTNLNVEDIEIPSLFLKEIKYNFKRQLVVDLIRNNNPKGFTKFLTELQNERQKTNQRLKKEGKKLKDEITVENAIDRIYQDEKMLNKMLSYLTDAERSQIESDLAKQIGPYNNITVADAQVFIRPDLYRKIRIGLGQWSFEPDENGYSDEEAYNIIEGITVNEDGTRTKSENPSENWVKDPVLYNKVKKLQLFPLKMSYFQNDEEIISDKISINRPIYNKMAIFPLFAFQRSTSVGESLYNRMNRKGNELDMISFKSAVKVGATQKAPEAVDSNASVEEAMNKLNNSIDADSNYHIDYTTGVVSSKSKKTGLLGVTIQDLSNLRMQQNTKAHDAELRAIGTQMFKIAFSNIIDDAEYGTGKSGRSSRKGWQIKKDIMACINALTKIGVEDIRDRFYKDGHIDNEAVEQFVKTVVRNNGLGAAAEEIIDSGGVASGIISRTVFENSISAVVNADVIDINTKGGTAIQQSVFGFTGYGSKNIGTLNYNEGRELKWSAEEGSMQVLLSMNFFKSVIPDYNNKTHDQRRQWLIDHNVIGDKAKPFGIGYRIPTQGMSSMFAFQVADVLPEQVADLIIVPREFTAQTGSDFDVDKLYLATMSYKNGVLETLSNEAFKNNKRSYDEARDIAEDRQLAEGVDTEDIDVTKWIQDTTDITTEDIRGAISNRLLLDYMDIISDRRNYGDARGSIDVITKRLKNELVNPVLKSRTEGYITGMTELLPSFQAMRKMEFGVGKDGIGPFALNITNLALTQYTHLTIDFGQIGEEYGFRPLDKIQGRDGKRISDWLSAMVNAHVDVAKDPYVFDLNINKSTYSHTNLLLRAGMGMATFTFLAQPALKNYANTLNNAGGLYGDNYDGSMPLSEAQSSRKKGIYRKRINYYNKILMNLKDKYKGSLDEITLAKVKNAIAYYEYMFMSNAKRKENGYSSDNKPSKPFERKDMFNEAAGIKAIKNFKTGSEVNEDNVKDVIDSIIFQLAALESFEEISKFAQSLSELVNCSRIDTKKFGNTIHAQIDFVNKYDTFRLTNDAFTINDPNFLSSLTPKDEKKGLTREEISKAALNKYFKELYLDRKLRQATKYTKQIISRQLFSATDTYESIFKNLLGIINGVQEREEIDGTQNNGYGIVYNSKSVDAFADGIDNMMRFNVFMTTGPSIYKNNIQKGGNTQMIDFTMGGDINAVTNKVKELIYGNGKTKSIFVRTARLINQIKKDPYSEKAEGLVDADGNITNDMLLYLNPQTPNDKYPIGRMLLKHSQTENKSSEERRLMSAFGQLLDHPSDEVRELARDLAFYSYFQSYDQNQANSFFHLVPYEYRKQYDIALRSSLQHLASNKPEIKQKAIKHVGGLAVVNSVSTEDAERLAASTMLDVISRNYWFDNNIVPLHITTNNPAKNGFQQGPNDEGRYEFTGPSIYDDESGRTFPTYIASALVKNDSPYIKLRKGSGTFLYKRIGIVQRSYVNDNNKVINATPFSIYAVVPKAGLRMQGVNQFEFYADYNTPSIFEQNKVESDYAHDKVRAEIEHDIERDKDGFYDLTLIWNDETVPINYMSSNTATYYRDTTQNPNKRKINGITVYNKKDPEKIGQKNADIILDVVNTKTSGEVTRLNIKGEFVDKVVELPMTGDLEDVIKSISAIKDKDVKIHLTTPLYDSQFDVSDEEYEGYIQRKLDEYSSQLTNEVEDRDSMIKAKEEALRTNKWTKINAAQELLNSRLHDLTQKLILSGVTIQRFSAAAFDGKTQLARGVAYEKAIDGTYFNDDLNTVFVQQELASKKKKFMNLLSQIDSTVNTPVEQQTEQEANVQIPEQELVTNESKAEEIIKKELEKPASRSRFAVGATEEMEESPEEETPMIVKQAEKVENKKEESKNSECGTTGGSRMSRFAKAATDIIEEE